MSMGNDNNGMENGNGERQWLVWAFRSLLIVVMTIGAGFGQQVWHGQERIAERLNAMDVERASFAASKFTASDWVVAKSAIDAQINASERRIFKLESSAEQITKALDRIESRLGTSKDRGQ